MNSAKEQKRSPNNYAVQDIYYLKPLHYLAQWLSVMPYFNLKKLDQYKPNYIYSTLWLGIFLAVYLFGSYGKVAFMIDILTPSVFITDCSSDLFLLFTNLMSITQITIIKPRKMVALIEKLRKIDSALKKLKHDRKYPYKWFMIEFLSVNILFGIYYLYDVDVWAGYVTWFIYKFFFLRDFQVFHIMVVAMVVRYYAIAIRSRMKILNDVLMTLQMSSDPNSILFVKDTKDALEVMKNKTHHERLTTKKIKRIYAMIVEAVEMYNEVFGWVFLTLYMNIIVNLLTTSNIALVYGIGDNKMGNVEFGLKLLSLCIIWAILPMVVGFFIFSACNSTTAEIRRTPNLCYAIIENLWNVDKNNILIVELERYAQQVANYIPEFRAAGFFIVNYATFFSLIGSISSYLIVLIQFR